MNVWLRIDALLRRRILFLLANFVFLVVIIVGIALPIQSTFADRNARIADQRKRLARLNAIVAQAAIVESFASDTDAQLRGGEFLTGANENVVGADLQMKLKAMIEGAGARSRSVQTLPTRTVDQVRYSGVRIDLSAPMPALMRAIYAIETAKPYLFVVAASLKSSSIGRQAPTEEPIVQAQLDVCGAMLIGGQP